MNKDYRQIHNEAPVADLHCDTVLYMKRGYNFTVRNDNFHIDIPRLIEGGVKLQVFACYLKTSPPGTNYFTKANHTIDFLIKEIEKNDNKLAICKTSLEAKTIIESGRIAIFLAIENGVAIDNKLENIKYFYDKGIRYMTLSHIKSHEWCQSSSDTSPVPYHGLSSFGHEVIREMNRLGMIVDVSHISVAAFEEVIKTSTQPVIASHSCVHSICSHDRNLTDNQIKAIADEGGMIGINFCEEFLSEPFREISGSYVKNDPVNFKKLETVFHSELPVDQYLAQMQELSYFIKGWLELAAKVKPSVKTVVDHIDYIVKLVGADYVGLGSDYDGIFYPPKDLENVSKLPNITSELVKLNYHEKDISKILGGNFFRVFTEVCG